MNPSGRRKLVMTLPSVLLALACSGLGAAPPENDAKPVEVSFIGPGGKKMKLSDCRGQKAVVLLFMRGFTGEFACHFCSLQTKDYKASHEEFTRAGAEVWIVLPGSKDGNAFYSMVGTDDADNPEPDFTAPFPVLLDTDFSACQAFGVPFDPQGEPFQVSNPATVVVGRDGSVLHAYHGEKVADRPTAREILDVLAGKKPPEKKSSVEEKRPAQPAIAWLLHEEGLRKAKAERRPVFIDFYADW